jgi:hypothetical protein
LNINTPGIVRSSCRIPRRSLNLAASGSSIEICLMGGRLRFGQRARRWGDCCYHSVQNVRGSRVVCGLVTIWHRASSHSAARR